MARFGVFVNVVVVVVVVVTVIIIISLSHNMFLWLANTSFGQPDKFMSLARLAWNIVIGP